jgi:hypothetical protein
MMLVRWWLPLKVGTGINTWDISRCGDGNGAMAWSFAIGIRRQ